MEILLSDSDETVFEGDAGELDQFSPPLSGRYEMRVTAQWVETSARRYSGRCVYSLDLLVKKEAEVLVSAQKVAQGGLFTVTVTNPEDPGSLKVTTGLGQASAFVKQQEGVCACLVAAQRSGKYPLFVSGTGVSGEHQIEVSAAIPQTEELLFSADGGRRERRYCPLQKSGRTFSRPQAHERPGAVLSWLRWKASRCLRTSKTSRSSRRR